MSLIRRTTINTAKNSNTLVFFRYHFPSPLLSEVANCCDQALVYHRLFTFAITMAIVFKTHPKPVVPILQPLAVRARVEGLLQFNPSVVLSDLCYELIHNLGETEEGYISTTVRNQEIIITEGF